MTTVHGESDTNVGNVLNSYNNITNVGLNEESLRIQAWLSPLKPHIRHQDVRNRRLDGVGDWVLERSEFESWCGGQDSTVNPTLLCFGGQGVGKTYISSLVIDTLPEQAREQNFAVLSLYCDYQAQKVQSAVNIIGSLLRQIAVQTTSIPDNIKSAFEESRKRGGQGLRLPEMLKLFVNAISSIERVFICIDAVDELLLPVRSEFLRALRQIIDDAPNTRLFLTSRPHIRPELDKYLAKKAYIIPIVADHGDITRYVSRKIDDDDGRDPGLMTEDLKNDIMKTLLEKSSDMFLLVALNIDAILGQTSLARRKQMLKKVAATGVDLDDVYTQTLQRIKEQKGDRSTLGMQVLMWVSHSERPLRMDELRYALAVEIGSTDLDPDNVRPEDTVLGSCLGLAMVDQETSTVCLIHYTLQEYLSNSGILPGTHATLAEACLTYLNHKKVKGLSGGTFSDYDLEGSPFLRYSSLYWGAHAKMEQWDRGKVLSLKLLNGYDNHISGALLLGRRSAYYPLNARHLFTGLHYACYFGLVDLVAALIKVKDCGIDQEDCRGVTPLMEAARQGNDEVARILLTRDNVNPEKSDNYGRTLLALAAINGHEGVVRLLLTRNDVNPDRPGNDGRTPLAWAARNGHEEVVRLLLTHNDVNPDTPGDYGRTPLACAAMRGHERVVRLLLTRNDVNPEKSDNYGRTPLAWATCNGHEGVVRLLLTRNDVNPDRPGNDGRTPLAWAARGGHKRVVRLLLSRNDVNPDTPDNHGNTALSLATSKGHEGFMKLFSEPQSDTTPDTRPLLKPVALSLTTIFSLIFLFHFLPIFNPSLTTVVLQWFLILFFLLSP